MPAWSIDCSGSGHYYFGSNTFTLFVVASVTNRGRANEINGELLPRLGRVGWFSLLDHTGEEPGLPSMEVAYEHHWIEFDKQIFWLQFAYNNGNQYPLGVQWFAYDGAEFTLYGW
jgi:hypothetical protein